MSKPKHRQKNPVTGWASFLSWLPLIGLALLVFWLSFGGVAKLVVVSGSSMYPTFSSGDLTLIVKEKNYELGDIIVYRPQAIDRTCDNCLIIHRIVEENSDGEFKTQGDNNDFVDQWWLSNDEILGKVVLQAPLGAVGFILFSPKLWLFVLSVILLIFVTNLVWRRWRAGTEEDDDKEDDPEDEPPSITPSKKAKKLGKNAASTGLALIVAATLAVTAAASAGFGLNNVSPLQSFSIGSCAQGPLQATTVSSADKRLQLSGIPEGCLGKTLSFRVSATTKASELQENSTLTVSGGVLLSNGLIAQPSTVTSVTVVIDGFLVPAVWNGGAPAVDEPLVVQKPGLNLTVTYTEQVAQQVCAAVSVSTTSSTPLPWTALLRIAGPPFNNDSNPSHYIFSNGNFGFDSATPVDGHFTVVGKSSSYTTVVAGSPREFTICNYGTPPPTPGQVPGIVYTVTPGGGTTYTVTPGWYVCQVFTVTTTGANRFFLGWDAVIDTTPLRNAYYAKSGSEGSVKLPSGDFSSSSLGGKSYRVWGTGWATAGIRDGSSQSFTVCWGG